MKVEVYSPDGDEAAASGCVIKVSDLFGGGARIELVDGFGGVTVESRAEFRLLLRLLWQLDPEVVDEVITGAREELGKSAGKSADGGTKDGLGA